MGKEVVGRQWKWRVRGISGRVFPLKEGEELNLVLQTNGASRI
jgi:hypothetical protein